jgi:hypothetical protein
MYQPFLLLGRSREHLTVSVADVQHPGPSEEVDEGVAIRVTNRRAASFLQGDRNAARVDARVALDCTLFVQQAPRMPSGKRPLDCRSRREVKIRKSPVLFLYDLRSLEINVDN